MSPPPKKTAAPIKGEQKLRIIGGRWRGRLLPFPDVDGLRPTGSRIRETLFNWLMPMLPRSRCLDLFAGSGALGFEALSRGAASVTLVEYNRAAASQLRANCISLQCEQAQIVSGSALEFLKAPPPAPYDLVFVDPPFAQDLWSQVVAGLQNGWLAEDAFIYLELPKGKALPMPANWHLHRQKHAGQVSYCLYRYETKAAPAG